VRLLLVLYSIRCCLLILYESEVRNRRREKDTTFGNISEQTQSIHFHFVRRLRSSWSRLRSAMELIRKLHFICNNDWKRTSKFTIVIWFLLYFVAFYCLKFCVRSILKCAWTEFTERPRQDFRGRLKFDRQVWHVEIWVVT